MTQIMNTTTSKAICNDEQLQQVLSVITLSPSSQLIRAALICELHLILRSEYNSCTLHPFGSYLTELGRDDSDLNIFVELGNVTQEEKNEPFYDKLTASHIANLLRRGMGHHRFSYDQIKPTRAGQHYKVTFTAKDKENSDDGSEDDDGVNVSISFKYRIHVNNSEMILLYTKLHQVVAPLIKLVQLWAKSHGIQGISSYALTLMVLVYAGYEEIIPSVEKIQTYLKTGSNKQKNIIKVDGGWDVTMPTNSTEIIRKFPASIEMEEDGGISSTLIELLQGFFHYYGQLDFGKSIICSNTFEIVQKTQDNKQRFFCVQDLFAKTYNVASAATSKESINHFQYACHQTYKVLEDKDTNFSLHLVFFPIAVTKSEVDPLVKLNTIIKKGNSGTKKREKAAKSRPMKKQI